MQSFCPSQLQITIEKSAENTIPRQNRSKVRCLRFCTRWWSKCSSISCSLCERGKSNTWILEFSREITFYSSIGWNAWSLWMWYLPRVWFRKRDKSTEGSVPVRWRCTGSLECGHACHLWLHQNFLERFTRTTHSNGQMVRFFKCSRRFRWRLLEWQHFEEFAVWNQSTTKGKSWYVSVPHFAFAKVSLVVLSLM